MKKRRCRPSRSRKGNNGVRHLQVAKGEDFELEGNADRTEGGLRNRKVLTDGDRSLSSPVCVGVASDGIENA